MFYYLPCYSLHEIKRTIWVVPKQLGRSQNKSEELGLIKRDSYCLSPQKSARAIKKNRLHQEPVSHLAGVGLEPTASRL